MNTSAPEASPQTVICLKWGDRYGPEYVNRLQAMVARHTARPLRFICITDKTEGLNGHVEPRPMPEFDLPETFRYRGFRRMFLFQESLYDLTGEILHFDLDLLVTGSIDAFFDYKPEENYVVAHNWTQPGQGIGNMSVFRYRIGKLTRIWERFHQDPVGMLEEYRNSQTFVSRTYGEIQFFPKQWVIGFKQSLIPTWPLNFFVEPKHPPSETKAVAFTGKPDPDEAAEGRWPAPLHKRTYKSLRPCRWIAEHWHE